MKLCIPASAAGPDGALDVRLGRAPYLVIVDTETGEAETIENSQNVQATQGAGVQTAQRIVEAGAQAVVAANCGPKAFAVLQTAGVKVYLAQGGSARELAEQLGAGRLQEMDGANVEGRWV